MRDTTNEKDIIKEIKELIGDTSANYKFVDGYDRESGECVSIQEDLTMEEIILDKYFIEKLLNYIEKNEKIAKKFKGGRKGIIKELGFQMISDIDNFAIYLYEKLDLKLYIIY